MNTTWGVYNVQGKTPDGTHVSAADKRATKWFVRWRVNGEEHKRTLSLKSHAKTFREQLLRAKLMGYPADSRGFPATQDPTGMTPAGSDPQQPDRPSRSFESYCQEVWWPTVDRGLGDRNRAGHRKNMRDAIAWLRYRDGDPRLGTRPGAEVGDSILLNDLNSDDIKYALVRRRNHNDRIAGVNARRIAGAAAAGEMDIEVLPEIAQDRTVNAFWITVGMIVRSAINSRQADPQCLAGAGTLAPKPRRIAFSERLVPSIQEVFDLAEAIAALGPRMADGQSTGEKFRALVLCAGTLGPRPGELVAHRPEWLWTEGGATYMKFELTEGRFYDTQAGVRGRLETPLKHRESGEFRCVPVLADVASALRAHLANGFHASDRTFSSPSGQTHLDWANLKENYWAPACARVFAQSSKPQLARMSPKTLRKAAITFWLDSGISLSQAAEWAGHSEEVAQRYYAGRVNPDLARETEMLARAADAIRSSGGHPLSA